MTTQRIPALSPVLQTARRSSLAKWLLPLGLGLAGLTGCTPPSVVLDLDVKDITSEHRRLVFSAQAGGKDVKIMVNDEITDGTYIVKAGETAHKFRFVLDLDGANEGDLVLNVAAQTDIKGAPCEAANFSWSESLQRLKGYYPLSMPLSEKQHPVSVERVGLEDNFVFLPDNAKCGAGEEACRRDFTACKPIRLRARPANPAAKVQWSGAACEEETAEGVTPTAEMQSCTIMIDGEKAIKATFPE